MTAEQENMKACYEFGVKCNWETGQIKYRVPQENFYLFKLYVQEYIKQNNIKPTLELALFFLDKKYKREILKLMTEENQLGNDFKQTYREYCRFCFLLKERGIDYCKKKNISWEDVEKYADNYTREFIQVSDLSEEGLMKFCYEICTKYNYNTNRIIYYCNLPIKDVKKYLRKYFIELKKEEIPKDIFWFSLDSSTKKFIQEYKNIIKLIYEEKIITYDQLQNPIWVNENLQKESFKFVYDLIMKFHDNYEELKRYCDFKGLDYDKIRRLALEYSRIFLSSLEVIKLREIFQKQSIKKTREILKASPSGYASVLNDVLKATNDLEIIDIINNGEQDFNYLKQNLSDYVIVYHNSSKEVREVLEKKLDVYTKYLEEIRKQKREEKEQKEKEKDLADAQLIIKQFLASDYDKIQDFCIQIKMPLNKFNEYVELIQNYDEELYKKYTSFIERKQSKRFLILFIKAKKIIKMIKTGVVMGDKTREFDLVDYYEITKLSFEHLMDIVKGKLSQEDYIALRTFIVKNKNDKEMTPLDIGNLYKNKIVVGVEFDKMGKVIPNTGREITLEEKQNIIKYLKSKNIPVTKKTYNIIYKRWLAGELLTEEKEKTK